MFFFNFTLSQFYYHSKFTANFFFSRQQSVDLCNQIYEMNMKRLTFNNSFIKIIFETLLIVFYKYTSTCINLHKKQVFSTVELFVIHKLIFFKSIVKWQCCVVTWGLPLANISNNNVSKHRTPGKNYVVMLKVKMGSTWVNTRTTAMPTIKLSVRMNRLNLPSAARTRKPDCASHKRMNQHLSRKYKSRTRISVVVCRVRSK